MINWLRKHSSFQTISEKKNYTDGKVSLNVQILSQAYFALEVYISCESEMISSGSLNNLLDIVEGTARSPFNGRSTRKAKKKQ